MYKSELLYDSLPVARVGVKKETEEVIIAHDFSCFSHMLEEYISYGAVDIYMAKSAPEVSLIKEMPLLLGNRIKVFDDGNEIEAMRRLLHNLRKEMNIDVSDEDQFLKYPKETPINVRFAVKNLHLLIKKLSIGFNHGIQIELNTDMAIKSLRSIRELSKDSQTRVILAQFESLMNVYDGISFDAPFLSKEHTPKEVVSIFDRLINDSTYLEYSDSIVKLSDPTSRNRALIEIREIERSFRSMDFISTGWNYTAKIIKAWSGVPVPDSSAISTLMQGRNIPALVDLSKARSNAIEMWKKSDLTDSPLQRDGSLIEEEIAWLPLLDSMKINSSSHKSFSLGTVGELKKVLEDFIED
jgi:hypothetical protein